MKIWKFFLMALVAGFMFILACSEDEPTSSGGGDPNAFCSTGLCTSNNTLKQQCIDSYNTCVANNPNVNHDECQAAALLICNV